MGNQISVKKKMSMDKVRDRSTISTKTFSESFTHNSSSLSSNHPKFAMEIFPDNTVEANRQRGEHYLLKHIFQVSHFAPVDDILKQPNSTALDIGCGPFASWLIDLANDFPDCTFHGFDLVKPFSNLDNEQQSIHIPRNCLLKKHDLLEGFGYNDETFDYIHQRTMHLIYRNDKIPWMFQEILRVTKPNGWIELVEPDTVPKRCGPLFGKLFAAINMYITDHLGGILQGKAIAKTMKTFGLVDIKSDYGSAPICWGGYIGKLVYEDTLTVLEHLGPHLYEYLDLKGEFDKKAFDAYIDSAFNECVEYQTFFNIHWAYGRKPDPNL